MPRPRFVTPEVVVLPLSDGDSVTVKRRLNHGEQTAAFNRMYLEGVNGALKIDSRKVGESIVIAYLVDWTFTDKSGAVIPIRGAMPDDVLAALNNLDPLDWVEVRDAVQAHDEAIAAQVLAEKKSPAGVTPSSPTSPSAD